MQLRREDNLREGDLIRVITYVDGFNLYFGLKSKGFKKYYWLDLPARAGALLKPGQELLHTHYFTTRIRLKGNNQPDVQRQTLYLEALAPRPQLSWELRSSGRGQRQTAYQMQAAASPQLLAAEHLCLSLLIRSILPVLALFVESCTHFGSGAGFIMVWAKGF
jgi:hypothetical protein